MKHLSLAAILALSSALATPAFAGPIEAACNRSDRQAATRSLCRCIDAVADQMLTRSEQRRAAGFFQDPDEAQRVRASTSRRDNEFWDRYRAFGERAEAVCTRG